MSQKVWECKVGFSDDSTLPLGSDAPMRAAIRFAFFRLTGREPEFLFSGWGAQLTASEREYVDFLRRDFAEKKV